MMNDEREMIICCAQILLDLPAKAKERKTLELIANALCVFAVADDRERRFIMDGSYTRGIASIQDLMEHAGGNIRRAKAWVEDMLSRPGREFKGRSHFKLHRRRDESM